MSVTCNIEKNERTARYAIGVLFIIAALLGGFSRFFAFLFGILFLIEGYLGWCAVPYVMGKFGKGKSEGPTPPTV